MLLSNCSTYPNEDELASNKGQIPVKLLLPNITLLIQPMDKGVLEYLKRRCCKSVLNELISQIEDDMLVFLNKVDTPRVFEKIANA